MLFGIGVIAPNGILVVHVLLWAILLISTHAELNVHVIEQVLISGRIGQFPSGMWCLVLLVPTRLPSDVLTPTKCGIPMSVLLST